MELPYNQNCVTYGRGAGGIFGDDCGHGFASDSAEYTAAAVGFVAVVAVAFATQKSPFAAALFATSAFRATWGAPTPSHVDKALFWLGSRAAAAWQISLLTWAHVIFSRTGYAWTTLALFCTYVYAGTAWALGVASIVCTTSSGAQPVAAYLLFDCAGVLLAALWLWPSAK